jgi:two-component system LytT family sensor kinase
MKKSMIGLLHLGYWTMYIFLIFWIVILMLMERGNEVTKIEPVTHVMLLSPFTIIFFAPAFLCFYTFYTFIFQNFLAKKKILFLIVAASGVSISSALLTGGILTAWMGKRFLFNDGYSSFSSLILIFSLIGLFHGVVGLVMRGFITWFGDIKLKEELNRKNYETELALMKAQLHPHFLFNTINNIDILIQKDPAKASAYLNKLSDIMRFMLYETKTGKIPLSKELTYIDKYIELQKIRTNNPNYINYKVEGDPDHILIEPLLFIPFIENAFKHAENKKVEDAIGIIMIIHEKKLEFECQNHYVTRPLPENERNGLGNELIKKRLELLYRGKHQFKVNDENGMYKVNLLLTL